MRDPALERDFFDKQEPTTWNRAEYTSGYKARFAGSYELSVADRYWHLGWQDADTELLESARQWQRVDAGEQEDFSQTGMDLYHVGGHARIHDFPFDETRTRPWKIGWVDADINLGTVEHGDELSDAG